MMLFWNKVPGNHSENNSRFGKVSSKGINYKFPNPNRSHSPYQFIFNLGVFGRKNISLSCDDLPINFRMFLPRCSGYAPNRFP